ncbi:hypothetical protein ACILG0_04510 [Pseudomonadota bacterium AL_CKDN230030165-1A_HGKHYDSX7]
MMRTAFDEGLCAIVTRLTQRPHAEAAFAELLDLTAPLDLARLPDWEARFRHAHWFAQYQREQAVRPTWRDRWLAGLPFLTSRRLEAPVALPPWIDLASGDGYARERALRALRGPAPNRFFFALALRRLNDWVPQVRAAAREVLLPLARASDPQYVVDVLSAILPVWTTWGRMQAPERTIVASLTEIDAVSAALVNRLLAARHGPAATVLSQCLRSPGLDLHLPRLAAHAVQPAVRSVACRSLLAGRARWLEGRAREWKDLRYVVARVVPVVGERPLTQTPAFLASFEAAVADRSFHVRRVAAQALVVEMETLDPATLRDFAQRLTRDPSRCVAERGEFILKHAKTLAAPA